MKKIMIAWLSITIVSIHAAEMPVKKTQHEIAKEIYQLTRYIDTMKQTLNMLAWQLLDRDIQVVAKGDLVEFYCGKVSKKPFYTVDQSKSSLLIRKKFYVAMF